MEAALVSILIRVYTYAQGANRDSSQDLTHPSFYLHEITIRSLKLTGIYYPSITIVQLVTEIYYPSISIVELVTGVYYPYITIVELLTEIYYPFTIVELLTGIYYISISIHYNRSALTGIYC